MIYRQSLNSTAEIAAWWDQRYQDGNGFWQAPMSDLDQHLDDFGLGYGNLRVLDVGCGDGSLVMWLIIMGHKACGIEISREAISRLTDHEAVSIHDICTGPAGLFDRIISLGSIEHVIDIDAALDNIRKSLAPGGRWYIFIPNERWIHEEQPNDRTATDREWSSLFRKHGLLVESAKRWKSDSTAFQGRVGYIGDRVEITSVLCKGPGLKWPDGSADGVRYSPVSNRENRLTPCRAYQLALELCRADILVYAHDDVTIHDPEWLDRLLALFENPNCVAAGPGGAVALGNRDLYRKPFRIQNMARIGYASNQTDAEVHGVRFTGERRVVVLEQFAMAVRVDWLRTRSGWPVEHLTHHMLDGWLACEAARDGREIWQAGFACHHDGGASSTAPEYATATWLQGGSLAEDHIQPHRWLMENYRDCLPVEVI